MNSFQANPWLKEDQGLKRRDKLQSLFINLLHPREHFFWKGEIPDYSKEKKKPVGNLITSWTKVKNKALPMRVLPKTMGPLKEMQLSPDNSPPGNSAHTKYYIIAILAEESLFTGQLGAEPSVTAAGFPPPALQTGHLHLKRNLWEGRRAVSTSLEQTPFYTAWEGKLSFPWNPTPRLKGDRPLQ